MFYARSVETWVKLTWTIQVWPGTIPFTVSRVTESRRPTDHSTHVGLMDSISNTPRSHVAVFQLPSGFRKVVDERFSFSPVRNTQAGGR